ncbi:endoglucanase 1 [Dendrothele bispora CBS 962.96]|uniref:cellulase n=1 Tax=Dendrothele bispora (strain CBS 962.96) TaxID=1314807 RepID=A0A4S8KM57_DENBC|nr:endoglucanase 1 [Dendrothele bispora CBS 962.96]
MYTSLRSKFALLLTSCVAAVSVGAKIIFAGVNESGGEFGSGNLPGQFLVDYDFINQATVDTFVDQEQINLFRVAFLMERMCPLATGLGSTFNETYFSEFEDAVNYITVTKGAYAILDPHNYMRYNDPSAQPNSGSIIGDSSDPNAATTEQFGAFWTELANRFVDNEKVIFGINNEPHDMDTQLIVTNNQAAIDGIRSTGAEQLIIAPGNGFTGGHSWTQTTGSAGNAPSSDFMANLSDPLNNLAIDIHEYLDVDFSGSHDECAQPGPTNLAALTSWLEENNLKAMVTEFGGGNNQNCFDLINEMLQYLADNDVYIGWSAWAAGPFWGTFSSCCGTDTGSLEPGNTNDLGGPNAFETVWPNAMKPNIPVADLKRSGVSSLS